MQEKLIENIQNSANLNKERDEGIQSTVEYFKLADKVLEDALKESDDEFKNKFDEDNIIQRKFISKAFIKETFNNKTYERPVIDLVQQGGGMFGIALLGYSYIMEKIGIRFYSHGGTSAGGINALFLSAISKNIYEEESKFNKDPDQKKPGLKSEVLTHIIANSDLSTFIDRGGFIGKLQKFLLRKANLLWFKICLGLVLAIFLLLVYGSFGLIFNIKNGLTGFELRTVDFVVGTLNILALVLLGYILFTRVLGMRFGINSGDTFQEWIEGILQSININTTSDLETNLNKTKLNPRFKNDKSRLVLITSNLTHNRIVKLPERAEDYWTNYKNIKPAAYVRATMAIPFVFEAFTPKKEHYYNSNTTTSYVKLHARFVDGGMLSNFPIREFHRNDTSDPRFPTFGVLLSERKKSTTNPNEEHSSSIKKLSEQSLFKYIISFLSTFRNFYDNDFLFNNQEIEKRVVTVDTNGYNWLNFWMKEDDKKELFKKGAEAAIRQLKKFDWDNYLEIRKSKTNA